MKRYGLHNGRFIHIVAAVLILCMTAADASLYVRYSENTDTAEEYIRTETHELDKAYADGIYDGTNSDSEHGDESFVSSTEGKAAFSILEIVPTEKKGVVGYSIGGCEPFDNAKGIKEGDKYLVSPQQMRQAYMDAFINKVPGSDSAKSWDYYNTNIGTINSKMTESGSLSPFKFEPVEANGYYLKVGTALGVYAEGGTVNKYNNRGQKIGTDKEMYSKFYDYDPGKRYEYIFVYSETPSSREGSINVTGHRRIQYTNNEKFIRNVFGCSSVEEALEWKNEHAVEVVVKTPMSVSVADIERADVIIVNNGTNMDYYSNAVEMNNIAHSINKDTDKNVVFNSNVDFKDFKDANGNTVSGFEKVIKIYERVAVREDVAFIGSRNCINGTTFDTNMHKLMCMLFFVGKVEDGVEKPFAGRDIFMNYMKRYVDEPGTKYIDAAKPASSSDIDVRYVNEDSVTYSTLRSRYEEHKNSSDSKLYADFRAPSLRNNDYYEGRPYMHMLAPGLHVGHPLVLSADKAIVGGDYVDGKLEPRYDTSIANSKYKETLRRFDKYEFIASGIPERDIWESRDSKGNRIYCYSGAYNSMSNATDYAYIDDSGRFIVTSKYSSNNSNGPYWFKIDYDGSIDGEYKDGTISRSDATYNSWPWSDAGSYMGKWVFAKGANGNDANLHLYYDYVTWGSYRPGNVPNGDQSYKNQSLEAENSLFKSDSDLIKKAVTGRKVAREKDDPRHIYETGKKDYYISMNILNGDGVNKHALPGSNNKIIYYNQYEYEDNKVANWESSNGRAYIPIKLRIRLSCKLKSLVVYPENKSNTPIVTYTFGPTDAGKTAISVTGSGSYGGRTISLDPDNELDANGIPTLVTTNDHTPVYTYNTSIDDVLSSLYVGKRNAKFVVQLNAIAPDGSTKPIEDTVTLVRRDFFMLD